MVIFHCYVSLPEGIDFVNPVPVLTQGTASTTRHSPGSFQARRLLLLRPGQGQNLAEGAQTLLPKSPWTANLKIFGRYEFAHADKHRILLRLTIEKKWLMILTSIFGSIVDDTHTYSYHRFKEVNHHQFVDHSPGPLPSGKHTKNYGTSPFFIGKLTINEPLKIPLSHLMKY